MRNPLVKRIPKELASDWHKYLVIIIFMVIMIGVISGMYVGHDSMLASIDKGREDLKLEDGSFELKEKASEELLDAISTGKMADVRQYFIDEGFREADEEVEKAIEEELEKQVTSAIEENVRAQCLALGSWKRAMKMLLKRPADLMSSRKLLTKHIRKPTMPSSRQSMRNGKRYPRNTTLTIKASRRYR